jgi:hypothetical protein
VGARERGSPAADTRWAQRVGSGEGIVRLRGVRVEPQVRLVKFFASMEAVGSAHGMMISRHPDSLNLKTAAGDSLQYMIKQDHIDIVVIANTDGLTEAQIEARKTELFGLSDKLVAEARSNAAQANVFE